jgi:uncharacterized membrane protein YidH (DUF202 family)
MQAGRLRQAWRVWICPSIFLQIYVSVLVLFFVTLRPMIESEEKAVYFLEQMLVFAIGGGMLAAWYGIMNLHEKVKQMRVRRRTKRFYLFFMGIYALYAFLMVCELVTETQHAV